MYLIRAWPLLPFCVELIQKQDMLICIKSAGPKVSLFSFVQVDFMIFITVMLFVHSLVPRPCLQESDDTQ